MKSIFIALLFSQGMLLFSQEGNYSPTKWIVKDPFNQKTFIENKGQFDSKNGTQNTTVFFMANQMGMNIYFSKEGLCYKIDKIKNEESEGREKTDEKNTKIVSSFIYMNFDGANKNVQLVAENKVGDYYTFVDEKSTNKLHPNTLIANAYQKIIYKNLYQNIDLEYIIPEKGGIKYSFTLHPGAIASDIKMKYSSELQLQLNANKNLEVSLNSDEIIDYAPITFYENEKGNIESSFQLNKNTITFFLANYDNTKTIIIDPWTINPAFIGANLAYDISKDPSNNIFVSGGDAPFYLKKYTSAGILIWTFIWPNNTPYYGDHCPDNAGNCFIAYGPWLGNNATKVSPTGTVLFNNLSTTTIYPMGETYKIVFQPGLNKLIGAGMLMGSGTLRTSLFEIDQTNGNYTNFFDPNPLGEIRAMASDPTNNIYCITVPMAATGTVADNQIIKINPTLTSNTYASANGYNLTEANITYHPSDFSAFNGIALGCSALYTFDGAELIKRDKTTGAQIGTTVNVTGGVPYDNGGIFLDSCGNVYVGTQNNIRIYDANLVFISAIATTGPVYDIFEGASAGTFLACGSGFISSFNKLPCSNSSINLTAGPPLTLNCTSASSGILTASSSTPGVTFSWSGPGIVSGANNDTVTVNAAGTYTVTVTDPVNCVGTSTTITVTNTSVPPNITPGAAQAIGCNPSIGIITVNSTTPGVNYSWTGSGIVSGNTNDSAIVNAPGTYTVTITNPSNGCTSTATVTVTINAIFPNVTGGPTVSIACNPSTGLVTASSTTAGVSYSWNGPGVVSGNTNDSAIVNAAGTYTVTVANPSNGCTSTATVTVTINAVFPNVTGGPTVSIACNPSTGLVTASSTTAGVSYSWAGPGVVSGNTTNAATVNATGTYTVTVMDANGCTKTATVTVNSSIPLPNVSTGNPLLLTCTNPSGLINANSSTAGVTYTWSGPGIVSGNTSNSATVNTIGTYTVTVLDPLTGCTNTSTITVTVAPLPSATASPDVTILLGANTTLTASGGGTYNWYPSTGLNTTTGSTVIASPTITTTYCAQITDNNGCKDTACVTVFIEIPCPTNKDLKVPNAFSPNTDGMNDEFCLQGWNDCIEKFIVIIFDRWGEKVFEATNPDFCWDGKFKGKAMDAQVFVFYIKATFTNSKEAVVKKGNVSLLK